MPDSTQKNKIEFSRPMFESDANISHLKIARARWSAEIDPYPINAPDAQDLYEG
jgi:hypothetical protein